MKALYIETGLNRDVLRKLNYIQEFHYIDLLDLDEENLYLNMSFLYLDLVDKIILNDINVYIFKNYRQTVYYYNGTIDILKSLNKLDNIRDYEYLVIGRIFPNSSILDLTIHRIELVIFEKIDRFKVENYYDKNNILSVISKGIIDKILNIMLILDSGQILNFDDWTIYSKYIKY